MSRVSCESSQKAPEAPLGMGACEADGERQSAGWGSPWERARAKRTVSEGSGEKI